MSKTWLTGLDWTWQAGLGVARLGRARRGAAGQGPARLGEAGMARLGEARPGRTGHGEAWQTWQSPGAFNQSNYRRR